MGSEHYCLRWNNHQSNLLGVFSQLLQDESLVDVTLACSEGASIRAHKVVLSACSSYFQSLFLDHPSRHPIVILKDVRFAELRTLIEFMYKGEVNVQYCQLSALLKTAESLKVKGLAEMTNQSSALREPEREQDRLRPPTSSPQNLDATATTTTTNSSLKRLRCSPSPPRHHQPQQSPLQIHRISPISERHHGSGESPPISSYPRKLNRERERDYNPETGADDHSQPLKLRRKGQHHDDNKPSDYTSSIDGRRSRTPDDIDEMDEDDDGMSNDLNETGINMTINSSNSMNSVPPIRKSSSPTQPSNVNSSSNQMQQPPPNSSASSLITSMIQVGNGNGSSATGNGTSSGSGSATTTSTCTSTSSGLIATSSGITSPMLSDPTLSTEPIAGPSGLGPVQSHPLSLKKEVDWDRSDDKSTGDSISDYRGHVHDSDASGAPPNPHDTHSIVGSAGLQIYQCMYCGATFPHQSKLTRHILSHSLETMRDKSFVAFDKFRDASHLLHLTNFPHEAHFPQRPSLLEPLEPPDGSMESEFAAMAAAAAIAAVSGGGSNSTPGGNGASSTNDQGNVVLCKFCGKSFPDVSSLITHLPVHTGDRPFKCEFCGKAFKLRHHMKDHCRVHTGERPFRCSMCGKTFSRSTILKAHEKTHFPKYVRKFLSPSPVDGKEEPPQ